MHILFPREHKGCNQKFLLLFFFFNITTTVLGIQEVLHVERVIF